MIDFEGFEPANTTPVPDILFDELLPELTEAELKILLYIIRRTWGFKKVTDAISLNQFQHGITTRDGKVLDKGCGIKNRTTLVKNLASLEKRKCIQSEKGTDAKGDKATTLYSICFKNNGVVRKTYQGSAQNVPPVVTEAYHRSAPSGLPVVRKTYPQETVIQETVIQETVIQESTYATSDEDRMPTRTESVTDIKQVAPDVQANLIRLQAQQQGEHHAEPSREVVEVSTGAQTSHAALGTVPRESPVPGEARISDDPKTSHDLDDVFRRDAAVSGHSGEALRGAAAEEVSNVLAPVSGAPARSQSGDSARGIADRVQSGGTLRRDTVPEAASLPTQASSTTPVERTVRQTPSSLPPNGAGAAGSAPPSSGPRRSGKGKTQVQDVTQALSLQGAQVKEWMETIKGRKRRMTPKNILAWNALAEEEDISFENLRDAIAKLESIKWVQEHDYVIDEQVLSQEGGNFTFSKGMELVRRKPKAASPEQFTSKTLDKERNDKRIAEMIEKSQKIRAEREAAQTTGK